MALPFNCPECGTPDCYFFAQLAKPYVCMNTNCIHGLQSISEIVKEGLLNTWKNGGSGLDE